MVGFGTVAEKPIRSQAVFFLEGRRPGGEKRRWRGGVVESSSCLPASSSCHRARAWGSPALLSAKTGVFLTSKKEKKKKKPGMSCPGKRA